MPIFYGATTSCGTQGETGPKGETGQQGPKGDTGEKGDKGDTYYPVVILESDGGTITTDKVDGMKDETYTLTFTPENTGDIVTHLYINYEEVELTDEILGGTYTGTFSSSVIVSAKFESIVGYSKGLILDYYNDLVEADNQLETVSLKDDDSGDYEAVEISTGNSDYYDDLTNKAKAKAVSKLVVDGLNDFEVEGETSSEKLADATEKIAEIEEDIAKAYKLYVDGSKALAKTYLAAASAAVTSTEFTDTDKETLIEAGETAIDACETVEALVAVVTSSALSGTGSYNTLYKLKASAFTAIAGALSAASLQFGSGETEQAATVEALKENYDIEASVPSEVAETYNGLVSAAGVGGINAVTTEGTSGTDLGDEAVAALKDCATNVKTELVAKIQNKYLAYVDGCAEADDLESDVVTRLKGAIYSTVAKWVKGNSSATVVKYLGTGTNDLIGTLEGKLFADPATSSIPDVRFTSYVIDLAKTEAHAKLQAAYNAVVAADSLYATAIAYTKESDTTGHYEGVKKEFDSSSSDTKITLDNPVVDVYTDETDATFKSSSTLKVSAVTSNATPSAATGTASLNAKLWLDQLLAVEDSEFETADADMTGDTTSIRISKWAEAHENDFEVIYEAVLESWTASCKTASTIESSLDSLKVITKENVELSFDTSVKEKTMSEILTIAESSKVSVDEVIALDTAVYEYVTGLSYDDGSTPLDDASDASSDIKFQEWVGYSESTWAEEYEGYSLFRKAVDGANNTDSLLAKVLAGSKAATVASENALDALYAEDLASYLAQAKAVVDQTYQAIVTTIKDVDTKNKLDSVYADIYTTNDDGEYTILDTPAELDSFDNVADWLKVANTKLNAVVAII